jgi:hypothetical protein
VTLGEPNDICEVTREMGAEICFVEQDDGTGAALMREDKIAFETAGVVVAVESTDKEQQIHVGGEDLLAQALAWLLARELRAPGQDLGDNASLSQHDPIADTGRIEIEMTEMAADTGGDFAG